MVGNSERPETSYRYKLEYELLHVEILDSYLYSGDTSFGNYSQSAEMPSLHYGL